MATADLVHLIDLSLGAEPCGVVNFNYLHGLLHEICKRLIQVEGSQGLTTSLPALQEEQSVGKEASDDEAGHSQTETPTPSRRAGSGFFKSRSSFVAAANDLSALERKLQDLENRVNTMESLPELLERKSSDSQSTPVHDMWNFTSLNKRVGATEEGLDKAYKLIDDLLGELTGLREQVDGVNSNMESMDKKMSGQLKGLESKVGDLEDLKLAAAKDSMGDAAAAMLSELTGKTGTLENEINAIKASLDSLAIPDTSNLVTQATLSDALSKHQEILDRHESSLKSQSESLSAITAGLEESKGAIGALETQMGGLSEEVNKLREKVQEIEAALANKVNVADLASLMPQGGSDDGASLMPKLLELQAKLSQMEGQLGSISVPSDLLDRITAMQNAIDSLQSQLSALSSSLGSAADDRNKLEELGSLVAQLRERMAELDRAVTAISNAVSQTSREGPVVVDDEDAKKYVDVSSFEALQDLLGQLHTEQERLIGTAAHLSHELDVSKEHVKTLYGNIDDLRETKADKEQLEVEVREKADKGALDSKASREWVDSTFERLDKEIREACSKLIGQEEALKSAVNQLEEDVDGKLDRMELEPLKDYFDKKLERVKPAVPVPVPEAMGDEAAGFKKPLRFRCISCDKPLGLKQLDAIPALPSVGMFPDTRSFRPYTTYELELIRKHQKMGSPLTTTPMFLDLPRSIRSAGGSHTMTRPRQRIRVAPLGQGYTPEPYNSPPPPRHTTNSPSVHDEMEIIGQDGRMYKGRSSMRNRLPPLSKSTKAGRSRSTRPSTSPMPPGVTT